MRIACRLPVPSFRRLRIRVRTQRHGFQSPIRMDTATPPAIEFRDRAVAFRDAKVVHPAPEGAVELVTAVLPRHPQLRPVNRRTACRKSLIEASDQRILVPRNVTPRNVTLALTRTPACWLRTRITWSSASRVKRYPRRSNAWSRSSNPMLARNGERGEPCGVPPSGRSPPCAPPESPSGPVVIPSLSRWPSVRPP